MLLSFHSISVFLFFPIYIFSLSVFYFIPSVILSIHSMYSINPCIFVFLFYQSICPVYGFCRYACIQFYQLIQSIHSSSVFCQPTINSIHSVCLSTHFIDSLHVHTLPSCQDAPCSLISCKSPYVPTMQTSDSYAIPADPPGRLHSRGSQHLRGSAVALGPVPFPYLSGANRLGSGV